MKKAIVQPDSVLHVRPRPMIKYTVLVYGNGDKIWMKDGQIHREDGPATEGAIDGWYWKGEPISEAEHKKKVAG